jgi:hypothetical protein
MDLRYGLAQPHGMPPRVARGLSKLAAIMVFHFGGSEWTEAFRRHHFSRQKQTDGYASITYTVSRMCLITLDLLPQIAKTSNNKNRMMTPNNTAPSSNKCHYRSCAVLVGSDVPRLICYAPGCDRVFHSYCYDLGVLRKNILVHFDDGNKEHPFLKIACRKNCYKKAFRHHKNMAADPEARNIPWNRDGRGGGDDPNNSENILIAWLKLPGNYNKFRSPPSGKTKAVVCEEVSRKINLARTLKIRKAPSVQMKIQAMEGAFRDAHDWVNNTGVGVLERDGQVTFEEAVTKRFVYYYDLVDVMSERASARPKASTDTMTMVPSSSSSSSSEDDDDDDDDDGVIVVSAPAAAKKTSTEEEQEKEATEEEDEEQEEATEDDDFVAGDEDEDGVAVSATFESPTPRPISTIAAAAINSSGVSSITTETTKKDKRKKAGNNNKNKNKKKTAKKNKKNARGSSRGNPHEIDGDDDSSWQTSMLDIKRGKVKLEQEKWDSQKQQHTLEIQLQQEKWKIAKQQQTLEYKFDLMVKYKKLQKEGFDNHQIVKMIPDMRPIIDTTNMPINLQLSSPDGETTSEAEAEA